MGEIFDLILDFERGLVQLLKDLMIRPQAVADKIVSKEKKYLAPYKFYTLVISLWIIYYQFYLKSAEFYSDEDLPRFYVSYLDSYENFVLLILPFLALLYFFIPVTLMNALLFRKKKLSFVNYISLNIYLAGLYMLSSLIVMVIAYPLSQWMTNISESTSDIFQVIVYALLFGFPALNLGFVHVKIFGQPKAWNFIKPLASFGVFLFVFLEFIDGNSFDSFIFKKLYYFSSPKLILEPSPQDFYSYKYVPRSVNYFTWTANSTKNQTGHSFENGLYKEDSLSMVFQFSNKTDTINIPLQKAPFQAHQPSICQLNPSQVVLFDYLNSPSNPSTSFLWDINLESGAITAREFKGRQYFSRYTRAFRLRDTLYFTNYDPERKRSFLGQFNSDRDSIFTQDIDFPNLAIRRVDALTDSSIAAIGAVMINDKLTEIHFLVLKIKGLRVAIVNDVQLYRNEFNPSVGSFTFLRISANTSRQVYTSYQLATDSSYATHIASYDLENNKMNWEKTYRTKADIALVSEVLFDEKYTYLLGRASSFFRRGFTLSDYCLPFIKVVDNKTGQDLGTYFLEQSDNKLDEFVTAYDITSGYFDDAFIYFCADREHFYQIDKERLTARPMTKKKDKD